MLYLFVSVQEIGSKARVDLCQQLSFVKSGCRKEYLCIDWVFRASLVQVDFAVASSQKSGMCISSSLLSSLLYYLRCHPPSLKAAQLTDSKIPSAT